MYLRWWPALASWSVPRSAVRGHRHQQAAADREDAVEPVHGRGRRLAALSSTSNALTMSTVTPWADGKEPCLLCVDVTGTARWT